MKTTIFHCDLCRKEIEGQEPISLFLFNEVLVNKDFQNMPVTKEAHFCKKCSEQIEQEIQKLYKSKVEEIKAEISQ